jgi:hypothetical protein
MVDGLTLCAGVPAVLWKQLGQQPQCEDAHQDGHIRYQHGRIRHDAFPVLRPGSQLSAISLWLFAAGVSLAKSVHRLNILPTGSEKSWKLAAAFHLFPSPHIGNSFFVAHYVDFLLLLNCFPVFGTRRSRPPRAQLLIHNFASAT